MQESYRQGWKELVEACMRRDRMAQKRLYDAWFGYGLSITMRYCIDRQEAVAALHDAFVLVFRKLDRYDPELDFKPWFRTIVVRAALDHLQAKRKNFITVQLEEQIPMSEPNDVLSRLGYEELLAMVRRLSEGYRTVFNLYAIDGFKHEEIAEKLGISVGTSKSNLFKARAQLQRMLEGSLSSKTS